MGFFTGVTCFIFDDKIYKVIKMASVEETDILTYKLKYCLLNTKCMKLQRGSSDDYAALMQLANAVQN